MNRKESRRFPIRFDKWYGGLSSALLLPPGDSYVEVESGSEALPEADRVRVRMGWAFRAGFPRSAVVSAAITRSVPLSRGVHGWGDRWLVNGSGEGIVAIDLQPVQLGYVLGCPVRLRQLLVSVTEPIDLVAVLGTLPERPSRSGRE
ncbi:hypothetical protein V0288_21515 [Pannus brasiliensis CCIBt3594]|uniref:Uncharacterized protein n=1 Tax=Pannus brasiliensis CCIBt3594 TaxID=1427578 RepID=A0AAW9QX62_9CHRO